MKIIFSFVIAIGFMGCMTFDRHSLPSAQIVAPEGIRVTEPDGKLLRTWSYDSILYITPPSDNDEFVIIDYKGESDTAYLSKHVYPWIAADLLSLGTGFFLDDVTNSWYDYNAIHVTYDTTRHERLTATSTNWLGESAESKRPSLLLLGDIGPGISSLYQGIGVIAELGVGIDFDRKYELFYSVSEPGYQNGTPWMISGRWFFSKHFFAQLSAGAISTNYDSASFNGFNTSGPFFTNIPVQGRTVPVLGAGAGWAGDYSYIALTYVQGTTSYWSYGNLDHYGQVALGYGLYLRF